MCVCGIWEKLFPKFFEKYQDLIKKHLDEIVLAFQKKKKEKKLIHCMLYGISAISKRRGKSNPQMLVWLSKQQMHLKERLPSKSWAKEWDKVMRCDWHFILTFIMLSLQQSLSWGMMPIVQQLVWFPSIFYLTVNKWVNKFLPNFTFTWFITLTNHIRHR